MTGKAEENPLAPLSCLMYEFASLRVIAMIHPRILNDYYFATTLPIGKGVLLIIGERKLLLYVSLNVEIVSIVFIFWKISHCAVRE